MPTTTRVEAHYMNSGSGNIVQHMLVFSLFGHIHDSMSCDSEICVYINNIIFNDTDTSGQSLQIRPFEVEPGHMITYVRRQIMNRS